MVAVCLEDCADVFEWLISLNSGPLTESSHSDVEIVHFWEQVGPKI